MAKTKKHARTKTLAHGRPPTAKPAPSMSNRATRTLIRTHHTLEKRRAKALANGDTAEVIAISAEIEKHGGIEKYQRASLLGQANDRGGDSSKILMGWLTSGDQLSANNGIGATKKEMPLLRMLEVGALSTTNACARSGLFDIERIDLNSQAEGITQQDFMERHLPSGSSEQFDIISLSLVLNYVPDATGRGEMLERTLKFLRRPPLDERHQHLQELFPSLFLVLPISCVMNSRYMDEPRLEAIMNSLGYVKVHEKLSNKLVYYLWRAADLSPKKRMQSFKKVEVRAGKTRNNFAVILK
jgi:25S rRNA (adenine2142-N1)-methyltransferase